MKIFSGWNLIWYLLGERAHALPFPGDRSSCTSSAHPPAYIQLCLFVFSVTQLARAAYTGIVNRQMRALFLFYRSKQPQSSVIWSLTIIQSGLRNLCTHTLCASIFVFHFKSVHVRVPSGFTQPVLSLTICQGIIGCIGFSGTDFHNILFIHHQ